MSLLNTLHRGKMKAMLVPLFLPLLLLLEVIIPVTTRLNTFQVISYRESKKTLYGPSMCALDQANETTSSSLQDCLLKCARDTTCTGINSKNSLTCDHINTPVLASTARTHSPVITSIHLYWLQHQELTHLWSHQYTCTGYNIKNSTTCDLYNYKPRFTALFSACTFFEVANI